MSHAIHTSVPKPFHKYGVAYCFGDLGESLSCSIIPIWQGRAFPFQGLVPSDDSVKSTSVIDVKPGDSSIMTGYQVNEFTHTWSTGFVTQLQIYASFIGKAPTLANYPLELSCGYYTFLEQAVKILSSLIPP